MSEAQARNERVRQRIAASQARLDRESDQLPALPQRKPLPKGEPLENLRGLATEYPLLTLAAGAGLGLLAGALLPKRAGGKAGRRLLAVAAAAGELGLALSKQAAEKAGEASRDGLAKLDQGTAPLRQRAGRAGSSARSQGVRLAGEAIKLAARLRR